MGLDELKKIKKEEDAQFKPVRKFLLDPNQQVEHLESQLVELAKENQQLQNEKQALLERTDILEERNVELDNLVADKEQEMNSVGGQMKNENKNLINELMEANERLKTLDLQKENDQREIERQKDMLQEFRTMQEKNDKLSNIVEEQLQNLKNENNNLLEEKKILNNQVEDLEKRLDLVKEAADKFREGEDKQKLE